MLVVGSAVGSFAGTDVVGVFVVGAAIFRGNFAGLDVDSSVGDDCTGESKKLKTFSSSLGVDSFKGKKTSSSPSFFSELAVALRVNDDDDDESREEHAQHFPVLC